MTARQKLVLTLAATDSTWQRCGAEWVGKCIHCRTRLRVSTAGDLLGNTTLEHIIPKTQGGTDAPENLALACGSCNAAKGVRHDRSGPGDPGYDRMVSLLQARRLERLRLPPEELAMLLQNAEPGGQ